MAYGYIQNEDVEYKGSFQPYKVYEREKVLHNSHMKAAQPHIIP